MSESVIDQLVLNMRVATGDVAQGLNKGLSAVKSFGGQVASVGSSVASVGAGMATGLLAGAVGAVYAIRSMTMASMEALGASAKLAARLGTDAESYAQLSFAVKKAGDDVESLQNGMAKMTMSIGSGKAKGALESMGLDPKQIKQMDPSQSFKTIANSIAKIKSPYAQASLAQEIFGKGAKELMNTLRAGGDAIDANAEKYKKLSANLSNVDYANIRQANGALGDMWMVTKKLGDLMAAEFAPYITDIAKRITEWSSDTVNMREIIVESMKWVAFAIGGVVDAWDMLGVGFKVVQGFITHGIGVFIDGLGWLGKRIADLINLIPGMSVEFGETTDAMAKDLHDLGDEQLGEAFDKFTAPTRSEEFKKWFDGVGEAGKKGADKVNEAKDKISEAMLEISHSVAEMTEKLTLESNTFGFTSQQVELYKLQLQAATLAGDEQVKAMEAIGKVKALILDLGITEDINEKNKNLDAQAQSVKDSIKTEGQKFVEEQEKLKMLHDKGWIDDSDFDKANNNLNKQYLGEHKGPPLASIAEAESNEARKIMLTHQYGNHNDDSPEAKIARAQLAEEKATRDYLRRMADNPVPVFAFGH
jgi:hypothetical protein